MLRGTYDLAHAADAEEAPGIFGDEQFGDEEPDLFLLDIFPLGIFLGTWARDSGTKPPREPSAPT
jgi:hypothetical protein